jgi:hypothetical protein
MSLALGSVAALLLSALMIGSGPNRAQGEPPDHSNGNRTILGDATMVDGNLIVTWAKVTSDDEIMKVGVTIPVNLFDNQPTEPGDGPAGAIASVVFPDLVRETTYLNHIELHSNPHGHETAPGNANPERNRVPHFDFHFYAIDEDLVWLIPAQSPPLPAVPAEQLPAGYLQPGRSVLQMGRHSAPLTAVLDPGFLIADMIAGFLPGGDEMHFVEPMISRDLLLQRNDFELPVPVPAAFGRTMLYPTKFEAEYDSELDAYHFVFSKFVVVE